MLSLGRLLAGTFVFLATLSNWANAMELAEALRITKAWATETGGASSLEMMKVEGNGAFNVEVKGAFFRYLPAKKCLLVSGLVADKTGKFFDAFPEIWTLLTQAGKREHTTLGEGQLELVKGPLLRWKPDVVLLTRPYFDAAANDGRFFTEVRWLLEWSTYWRTRRYGEVIRNTDENALIREADEINNWVTKNRPRPW